MRKEGLEPSLLSERTPKARVSANFTTSARLIIYKLYRTSAELASFLIERI